MTISFIKKSVFLFIFLLPLSGSLFAQDDKGWFKRVDLGLEKSFYTDLSVYSAYWKTKSDCGFLLSGNTEFVIAKPFLTAPKVSITYLVSNFLLARTDFSLYSDFKNTQPVITPKIGFTFFGLCFYYGRNISLNQTNFNSLGKNQFTIGVSAIPKIHLRFF